MGSIVCFTGHRVIPDNEYLALSEALEALLEELIAEGAEVFRAGGARGFDTMAAMSVLLLRKRHPHIRLELILPCPDQTAGWPENDALVYRQILERADSYSYLAPKYYKGVLQARNRALVEGADICIAYLSRSHGGTAYTSSLALKKGLHYVNLKDLI